MSIQRKGISYMYWSCATMVKSNAYFPMEPITMQIEKD